MLSFLCKTTERVIPLSSQAVTRNGPAGGKAQYTATFLATSSSLMDRICPRSLVLWIFKSVKLIFTAFGFSFCNHCYITTVSFMSGIGFFSPFFFRPFFGVSPWSALGDDSTPSASGGLCSVDPC